MHVSRMHLLRLMPCGNISPISTNIIKDVPYVKRLFRFIGNSMLISICNTSSRNRSSRATPFDIAMRLTNLRRGYDILENITDDNPEPIWNNRVAVSGGVAAATAVALCKVSVAGRNIGICVWRYQRPGVAELEQCRDKLGYAGPSTAGSHETSRCGQLR